MSDETCRRILRTAGALGALLLGLWLLLWVLLPWTLPLWAGLGLALLLERPVRFLTRRLRLPRWAASAVCTVLPALAVGADAVLALWRLWYEAMVLVEELPLLLAALSDVGEGLEAWSYRFLVAAPPAVRAHLEKALSQLSAQSASWPAALGGWLAQVGVSLASALPGLLLFLFTTVLATYLASAGLPQISAFVRRQLSGARGPVWRDALQRFRRSLGGWVRAQLLLLLCTFGELALGFLLLGVEPALLLALLISLLDALPVFGTGTALAPWGLFSILTGSPGLGLGLLLLWGATATVRSLLEPRLVGSRSGVPPLIILTGMYAGSRAAGVAGMVLAPLLLILLKETHDSGLLRLWGE